MMALTATANYTTHMLNSEPLEMHSYHEIIHLPNNQNLHYSIMEKPTSDMEMDYVKKVTGVFDFVRVMAIQ